MFINNNASIKNQNFVKKYGDKTKNSSKTQKIQNTHIFSPTIQYKGQLGAICLCLVVIRLSTDVDHPTNYPLI